MKDYVFEAWFKGVFLKYVADILKPVVVFFDGHGSLITFDTAHKAKEATVHIVCLPSHTSSALQPLDVGVYGPAKKVWYQILQKFYRKSRQQTVSKPAFPTLLKELYKETSVKKPNNTISGFKKSGLCPLDKERVPKSKIKPSSAMIPVNSSTPTQNESNVEFNIASDTPRSNAAANNSINSSNSIVNTPPVRPVTPRKALRTNLTASTLQNAKKRKRVQREHGEVLTYEESHWNDLG